MGAREQGERAGRGVLDTAGERAAEPAEERDGGSRGGERSAGTAPGTLPRRLLWFGALWAAGVATVSLVAYGIRAMIMP